MIILLDVAAPPFLSGVPEFLIGFMILAIFLEGWGLQRAKYGNFKQSLFASFVANIVSMIVGWFFMDISHSQLGMDYLFVFFLLSVIIEGVVIYFMNKEFRIAKTLITTVIINAASYLILAALVIMMKF